MSRPYHTSLNSRLRLRDKIVARLSSLPLGFELGFGTTEPEFGAPDVRHENTTMSTGGAPRWEKVARLAIRLNREEPGDAGERTRETEATAAALCEAAGFNDVLLREALAVFVTGAERGRIGARAAESLRLAIRLCDGKRAPFRGVRLRGRRRASVEHSPW